MTGVGDSMCADEVLLMEIVEPHVALLTLNRPQARNAVNGALAQAFAAAASRVEDDPDIWACVVTGAGDGAFCAGVDLKEAAAGLAAGFEIGDGGLAGFVRAPRTKVWIAAAQSHALGGGLELLLACDLAVAAESATFGLPEVRLGLIAGGGGVVRLPRTVPKRIAFQMITTAQPISAQTAHRFGLVNDVVPAEQVQAAAIALARQVCANSPAAVRESLVIARRSAGNDETELWAMVAAAIETLRAGPDFTEGPRAFSEKRTPRWVG